MKPYPLFFSDAEGIEFRLIYRNSAARGILTAQSGSQWNYPNQFGIFVIQKSNRDSRKTETPLECYYVIGGTIFKAPSLGDLVRQRILTAVKHLESLLTNLSDISSWSLIEGYSWGSSEDDDDEEEEIDIVDADTVDRNIDHQVRFHRERMMRDENELMQTSEETMAATNTFQWEAPPGKRQREQQSGTTSDLTSQQQLPVTIEDLYTKRHCNDAMRVIEETFTALATASLNFNDFVAETRSGWIRKDEDWQQQQLESLQHLDS